MSSTSWRRAVVVITTAQLHSTNHTTKTIHHHHHHHHHHHQHHHLINSTVGLNSVNKWCVLLYALQEYVYSFMYVNSCMYSKEDILSRLSI